MLVTGRSGGRRSAGFAAFIAAFVIATVVLLPPVARAEYCEDMTLTCSWLAEAAAPSDPPVACPTTGANACLEWTSPTYCVGFQTVPAQCTNHFSTIQAAINAMNIPAGQTILVAGYTADGEPPVFTRKTYVESLTLNKRVCLKAGFQSFLSVSPGDYRYAPKIQTLSTETIGIEITAAGNGSCIHGFDIDHRATVAAPDKQAIRIGTSGTSTELVDDVRIVGNRISMTNSNAYDAIFIAGKNNVISRNVILGVRRDGASGVQVRHDAADISACTAWDGNLIVGNYITSFKNGILYQYNRLATGLCNWTGNRIDRNDIRDCNTGIRIVGADDWPIRLIVMENQISEGRRYTSPRNCRTVLPGDLDSTGIWLGDTYETNLTSNRISGVDVGIELDYHACWTQVRRNQVTANLDGRGIWVCPTHCNLLSENVISSDPTNSYAIDFQQKFDFADAGPSCFDKQHGRHKLDGGLIRRVKCLSRDITAATVDFGVLPGYDALGQGHCQ